MPRRPAYVRGGGSGDGILTEYLIWAIVALGVGGILLRPFGWPEAAWAVGAALLLVICGLLPVAAALRGVARGMDVYLFLTGMMLLSELARREKLFDWLAALVARRADGSAAKLFLLVYVLGTVVTVFLSNDATAVVLTPAVAAMVRAVQAKDPLPYLLVCAFVANAASFVLPISNPANLVIYGSRMPGLLEWLPEYGAPSMLCIVATFLLLRFTQRRALRQNIGMEPETARLRQGGRLAGCGILGTGIVLMAVSAAGLSLGLPTFLAGAATAALVLIPKREMPWGVAKGISWSVLPLVAGLFVMVAALDEAGAAAVLSGVLRKAAGAAPDAAVWGVGLLLGFGANLVNNLPAGLLAGHAVQAAGVSGRVTGAALIGVDLGPNLSVTGSLATILWLTALRREGLRVSAWQFLRLGVVVMPPALVLALAGLFAF
jgi:arsenical pump membrane protein